MEKKKEHADFQDEYKRSSNFGKTDAEQEFEIKGDGKLKMEKDDEIKAKEDKKKIDQTLNKISTEEEE